MISGRLGILDIRTPANASTLHLRLLPTVAFTLAHSYPSCSRHSSLLFPRYLTIRRDQRLPDVALLAQLGRALSESGPERMPISDNPHFAEGLRALTLLCPPNDHGRVRSRRSATHSWSSQHLQLVVYQSKMSSSNLQFIPPKVYNEPFVSRSSTGQVPSADSHSSNTPRDRPSVRSLRRRSQT